MPVGFFVLLFVAGAIAAALEEEASSPSTTANTTTSGEEAEPTERSRGVQVEVLGIRENPPIPDRFGDGFFNRNQTPVGIRVRVTNDTEEYQEQDYYLKGEGDEIGLRRSGDTGVPGVASLFSTGIGPGGSFTEELIFGMRTDPKELIVTDASDDQVVFTHTLDWPPGAP